jgi:hypothetical protein
MISIEVLAVTLTFSSTSRSGLGSPNNGTRYVLVGEESGRYPIRRFSKMCSLFQDRHLLSTGGPDNLHRTERERNPGIIYNYEHTRVSILHRCDFLVEVISM